VIFGFNTDIRVGASVYHVQTEDRGPSNPVLDTTVYTKGRVVHRLANSYKELLHTPGFGDDALRQRLEEQHRRVIEELRAGTLRFEAPPAEAAASGVQVQLLNPASWLAAGTATLKLEVKDRASGAPVPQAEIQVRLESARGPVSLSARTDAAGRAEMSFPLPRVGPGGTDLVIFAAGPGGGDEIRYSLRPKQRFAAP
jgi:hypothetical protein